MTRLPSPVKLLTGRIAWGMITGLVAQVLLLLLTGSGGVARAADPYDWLTPPNWTTPTP